MRTGRAATPSRLLTIRALESEAVLPRPASEEASVQVSREMLPRQLGALVRSERPLVVLFLLLTLVPSALLTADAMELWLVPIANAPPRKLDTDVNGWATGNAVLSA
jgi:hypothetical protein